MPVMPVYLEFEVSLLEIKPRIWRRFQIDADDSFGDLHLAIQNSFDWDGDHMWEFSTTGRNQLTLAGPSAYDLGYESDEIPDAWSVKLAQYFGGSARICRYTYDLGDYWIHAVKLRRRVTSPERFLRRLLTGARAAPIEDCGGHSGYWQMVEDAESGPSPSTDAADRRWFGDWKPDRFDLQAARAAFDQ